MEENKELDAFIKKSIQEVGLDTPSLDFTNSVMSKIQIETERSAVFVHKPLFSKSTWFAIISMVIAIFAYVIFGQPEQETTWLWFSKLNDLASFNLMGSMPNIAVSRTLTYGILAVTFFVWVQIFLLKKHIDKSYSLN
jgi:hypothetical protein